MSRKPVPAAAGKTRGPSTSDRSTPEAPTRLRLSPRRRRFRLTLALALALLLVGLAGLGALTILHDALRPPTATDEASAVCAFLQSRDYDALAAEMDPTPTGATPGAFDRVTFTAQLRALDRRDGPVNACQLRLLGSDPTHDAVVFALTVRRARLPDPRGSLVVVERTPGGRWKISRASTFYDIPA